MKQILLFFLLLSTLSATAQLSSENFDSYNAGAFDPQWNPSNWVGWFGSTSNVDIDNTFSRSAPNSMVVNSTTDDVVALLGTLNTGTYEITFYQYIPTGFGSYYNIQHNYTNSAGDWAAEVYFGDNNTARITTNGLNTPFTPVYNQWVENKMEFNFQADEAKFFYNGTLTHTWTISTNAAGGSGLNQVNGINFYGACDGTGCLTTAYYDDITVVQTAVPSQYDATVLTKPAPMPYTQIPDSLMTPMSFSAEVINYGMQSVSNVQVEFKVYDGANTMVHSELSNVLSFLASNATGMVYGSGAYLPPNQTDIYTITYDVSITETDDNPQNNSDTLQFNVLVSDSTYSKDDGNYNDGIGASGAMAILGQNFEFVEDVHVHSVSTSFAGGLAGDQIRLNIYEADINTKKPINIVYSSAPYTLTAAGGGIGNETYVTFYTDSLVQLDSAGLYTFAIEQMSTNNILLSTSPNIFKTESTLASTDNGSNWTFLEDFAFEVAMNIRPVVSLVPDLPPSNTTMIEALELVEITPNPNNGQFMLRVELSENLPVQVDVFNINGQLIQSIAKGNFVNIQERIDLSNEAAGIYLVRLQVGNEVLTKKVIIE